MAIVPIENQPISFTVFEPDPCNLNGRRAYCADISVGDTLYSQWRQTPCGSDLVCDPDFSTIDGALVNPNFNTDLSGWTVVGGWIWQSGTAFINSGSSSTMTQTANLTIGVNYTLTFEVVNYVSGNINIEYDGVSTSVGVTGDGVYTVALLGGAGTDLVVRQSGFVGAVDNFYFEDSPYTSDCWTVAGGWQLTPNGAVHTIGTEDDLTLAVDLTELTNLQQIIIEVTDRTAGTITLDDGVTTTFEVIDSNGVFYRYGNATADYNLIFTASDDFDGTIKSVSIYELRTDFEIYIADSNGDVVTNITSAIYDKDTVTVAYDTASMAVGCYTLNAVDTCGIFGGDENIYDPEFDIPVNWVLDNISGTSSITGGIYTGTSTGGAIDVSALAYQSILPVYGPKLLSIIIETGDVDNYADAYIELWDGSDTQLVLSVNCPAPNTVYTNGFIIDENYTPIKNYIDNSLIDIKLYIKHPTATGTQKVELKRFSYYYGPVSSSTETSNCFNVNSPSECLKQLQGYQSTDSNALGFYFESGSAFRLSARYEVLKFNPFYPVDGDDYNFSSGSIQQNYASREKWWEVWFNDLDEGGLDAITAMVSCNVFMFAGIQYFVRKEDFKPEWDKDGKKRLAKLRMVMRKINSTIYNS